MPRPPAGLPEPGGAHRGGHSFETDPPDDGPAAPGRNRAQESPGRGKPHSFQIKQGTQDGNGYMLSNDRNRWLPGRQSGRNTPRFIAEHIGSGRASFEFDSPASNKYVDWIASCCSEVMIEESNFRAISKYILEEAVKLHVVSLVPSSVNYKIYGLNKERVFITDDVVQMRCDKCGSVYAVSAENAELWNGAPCQRSTCGGFLEKYETGEINYYGRLYSAGDLVRINAREHTGLLERPNREQLETDFKRGKDTQELWDPRLTIS